MSDEQPVSRGSTGQDNWFNVFCECALAAIRLPRLFTRPELERIFANTGPWRKSRRQAVQFLLGHLDEQLCQQPRLNEQVVPLRDRCRSFFVGKETAQKFGGSLMIAGGK